MMNRRENFLRFMNHEPHDHIPCLLDVCMVGGDNEYFENGPIEGGMDDFGCGWVKTSSGMGAGTPAPGDPVIPNPLEWEKYLKLPNPAEIDWEAQVEREMQFKGFNPEEQVLNYGCWNGPFLRLTHLMGFENGLMALFMSPDACKELLDKLVDYRIETLPYIKKYYNPDYVTIYDDFATSNNLFLSPHVYEALIAPQHKRFFDAVRSYDMIPSIHICGKCEDVVPSLPDEGTTMWEICEPSNDLVSLAEQVGDRLAFFGGLSMQSEMAFKQPTEEELVEVVHEAIDKYGPAGNYGFMGMYMFEDMNEFVRCMVTMNTEAIKYGTNYYVDGPGAN